MGRVAPITRALTLADKRARVAELRAGGGLAGLAAEVAPVVPATERVLEAPAPLDQILPGGGLRRGSVVGVDGPGATSLALTLVAGTTAAGSWAALVGVPEVGLLAAHELGVALARCLVVDLVDERRWADAVGAVLGGVDLVLTRVPPHVEPVAARRIVAVARERDTTVVRLPGPGDGALVVEQRLRCDDPRWMGLGAGEGRLVARRSRIGLVGRRRSAEAWLPGAEGRATPVTPLRSVGP